MRTDIRVLVVGADPTLSEGLAHMLPRKGRVSVLEAVSDPEPAATKQVLSRR